MPNSQSVQEIFKLEPSGIVDLFEVDGTENGNPNFHLYFYDGRPTNYTPIVYGGNTYIGYPIELSKKDVDGKGTLPRPQLSCSNINGFISMFLLDAPEVIGTKVIRKRVFVRNLDVVNFPNNVNPYGTPSTDEYLSNDTFYIFRIMNESQTQVTFELCSPFEIDGVQLPKRKMFANICSADYRDGITCPFAGAPCTDKNNVSFTGAPYNYTLNNRGQWSNANVFYYPGDYVYITSTMPLTLGQNYYFVCKMTHTSADLNRPNLSNNARILGGGFWIPDACPKNLLGCKMRYPSGSLPFNGFPGLSRAAYQS